MLAFVDRDAGTVVGDGQARPGAFGRDSDRHARARMPQRVVEKDPDQLADRIFVTGDGGGGRDALHVAARVHRLRLTADFDHNLAELDWSELEREPRVCPG